MPVQQEDIKHDSAATKIWQTDHILAHEQKVTGKGRITGKPTVWFSFYVTKQQLTDGKKTPTSTILNKIDWILRIV